VKSGYLKDAQSSPKPASIVDVLRILKNGKKSAKKEGGVRTYFILCDYNFVYFKFIVLYCIICGASFTTHVSETFVIFMAVIKQIKICYKSTDSFVAETVLYLSHTQMQLLLL
jgi:hypothetical protein